MSNAPPLGHSANSEQADDPDPGLKIWRPAPETFWFDDADQDTTYVLTARRPQPHILRGPARYIWGLVQDKATFTDLVERTARDYGQESDDVKDDITSFLMELEGTGAITRQSADRSPTTLRRNESPKYDGVSILHVDHSAQAGGGQLSLLRYLRESRIAHHRCIFMSSGPLVEQIPDGVPAVVMTPQQNLSSYKTLRQLQRLRRLLKDSRDDLIVVNSVRSALAVAMVKPLRRQAVCMIREDLSEGVIGKSKRRILAVALSRYQFVVSNSQYTADQIPGTARRRSQVKIAHPVSGATTTSPPRSTRDTEPLHFLFLGRISPWKGIDTIVRAATMLRAECGESTPRITVAGGAPFGDRDYAERIQCEAARSGAPITFIGHQDDVNPLLEEADVLIHASLTPEPFGQVLVQAMNAGLCVIATKGGGPSELITNGINGILVEPGDPTALAAAMRRLSSNPALVAAMGTRARRAGRPYLDDVTAGHLDHLFASAVLPRKRLHE